MFRCRKLVSQAHFPAEIQQQICLPNERMMSQSRKSVKRVQIPAETRQQTSWQSGHIVFLRAGLASQEHREVQIQRPIYWPNVPMMCQYLQLASLVLSGAQILQATYLRSVRIKHLSPMWVQVLLHLVQTLPLQSWPNEVTTCLCTR